MFSKDFIWGVASSAYQVEGTDSADGRGKNVWDTFTEAGRIYENQNAYTTCDHMHRYKDDYALMRNLGIKAYRFSLNWARILPEGIGRVNEKAIAMYRDMILTMKENGIQLMYHNHDFEFNKYEDKFLLDWIFETLPEEYMQPEIDTCWVHYAGYDPSAYLMKYAGRIKVVHLKDFVCKNLGDGPVYALIGKDGKEEKKADKSENGFEFRPVGHGIQDIPAIIDAAEKAGAEILIVEQDMSVDRPPLEAAKMSRDYLKSLGL